jgi:cytohesin
LTPLHYAASDGNAEVVKVLIEAGADVMAVGRHDWGTPIQRADDIECVLLLLAAGADINAHGEAGSILYDAASRGDLALVEALLALGADPANVGAERSAMAAAAESGSIPIAERLVAAGADVHCPMALCHVARECNLEFVKYLLDLGSDPNGRGWWGTVPLVEAVGGISEYGRAGPGREVVELLLARGADVNLRGSEGSTALFSASADGMTECVQVLLAAGADPDIPDDEGRTALMAAASCKRDDGFQDLPPNDPAEVVAMLLDAGANPCAVDNRGQTALEGSGPEHHGRLRRAVAEWIPQGGAPRGRSRRAGPG